MLFLRPDGTDVRTEAEVAGQPSGLGWLPDGRLLMVSMRDRRVLRREAGSALVEHADLSTLAGWHLDDMLVDAAGRAYAGNFGFDLMAGAAVRTTDLHRVDPDGKVERVADDLHFPNGMAVVDEDLVVAESLGNRLSAFPIAPDGGLGERRDWAGFGGVPTSPTSPKSSVRWPSRPTASARTPRARCGWPTPSDNGRSGYVLARESWRRSTRVPGSTPACSAVTTATRSSCVRHRVSSSTTARHS